MSAEDTAPQLPARDPDAGPAIDDQASEFLYARERWQAWVLRASLGTVAIILLYLAGFSYVVFDLFYAGACGEPPGAGGFPPTLFLVSLFVTPVVSMTAILVFALVGVFRGFRDRDIGNLPVTPAAKVITGTE